MDEQTKFDLCVGRLDRVLSELVQYARDPATDSANKQTLKHHAEDMIAAGQHILKKLGAAVEGCPQPQDGYNPPLTLQDQQALNAKLARALRGDPAQHDGAILAISEFISVKLRERQSKADLVGTLEIKLPLLDDMLPKPDWCVDARQVIWDAFRNIVNAPEPPMFVSRD